jgi:hypothetical protein
MDDAIIEAEAREYVEQVVRNAHRDRRSIPPEALKRALEAATASAKELHAAVKLAEETKGLA